MSGAEPEMQSLTDEKSAFPTLTRGLSSKALNRAGTAGKNAACVCWIVRTTSPRSRGFGIRATGWCPIRLVARIPILP